MEEKSKFISGDSFVGNISLKWDRELFVDFSLNLDFPFPKTDVLKIYLFTSDDNSPAINMGTAMRSGNVFFLSKKIEPAENWRKGDIVGAEIVQKNVYTEEQFSLVKAYFCDERNRETSHVSHDDITSTLKTPLETAIDALEKVRKTLSSHSADTYKKQIDFFEDKISQYEKIEFPVCRGFVWRKVNNIYENFMMTSIKHILSSEHTFACLIKSGYYIVGYDAKNRRVAVAVPYEKGRAEPLERADDCRHSLSSAGSSSAYAIVGILLEPDGQYFATIDV